MNENRDPLASILQCHVKFHSLLFFFRIEVNTTETNSYKGSIKLGI